MIIINLNEIAPPLADIQKIAQVEPVILTDGENQQILMDYQDFMKMTAMSNKPFISLGEVFTDLPPDIAQALAQVEEDDIDTENMAVVG